MTANERELLIAASLLALYPLHPNRRGRVFEALKEVMPPEPDNQLHIGIPVATAPAPSGDAGADEFAEMARKVAESWVCVGNGTKTGLQGMIECALRSVANKRTRECAATVVTVTQEADNALRIRYPEAFRESQ